ncbi:MAG: hypothetical protein ACPF9D_02300 [Owenweeksia sp.]
MIKIIGLILLIVGALGLIFGLIGIFGQNLLTINAWAMAILGVIFFTSGTGMLKRRRDTDEIN